MYFDRFTCLFSFYFQIHAPVLTFILTYFLLLHKLENVAQPVYSSACNASSPHNQLSFCNNQRHLAASKVGCTFYAPPSSSTNNGGTIKTPYSNQFAHQSSIPHSKSLDHYNEPMKFPENQNARHSFDQTISSTYKNYDCTDEIYVPERGNGFHCGVYHQPNCSLQSTGNSYNVSGNRYLPATLTYPDHHYTQISGFDRGDNFIEPVCCHQSSHYECLNHYGRPHLKPKNNTEYSNFPPK